MSYILWGIAIFIGMSVAWVYYLAIMNLKRNKGAVTPVNAPSRFVALLIGIPLDVFFHATVGTIIFAEHPFKEWLMTDRLQRHLNDNKKDWRDGMAHWFCRHFLNPFDPTGRHC